MDLAANRNGPNRFGWVVEIDPFDPTSMPVKRTALGRIKHEGALVTESRGRVVVYTGDDQDGDYLYKFVGNAPWRQLRAQGKSPLDHGTLYVARFNDDGSGDWLPLVHGQGRSRPPTAWSTRPTCCCARAWRPTPSGATKMDRPEWIAENPRNGEVFVTLTNGTSGANAPNPRYPNPYGHIIKWRERNGDKTRHAFEWDVFVLAGDPQYDPTVELAEEDIFGSPDGLCFDRDGRLWIETDISNSSQNLARSRLRPHRQQRHARGRPAHGRVPPLPRRAARLRDHRRRDDAGPGDAVRQRPASRGVDHRLGHAHARANPRAVSNWPDFDPAGRPRSATVAIRKIGGGTVGT